MGIQKKYCTNLLKRVFRNLKMQFVYLKNYVVFLLENVKRIIIYMSLVYQMMRIFFIENYDLLSRENALKILFPDKTKVINQSAFGASYYFGRTDYIQSDFVHVPKASLNKSIKEDKVRKEANIKKQKIGKVNAK